MVVEVTIEHSDPQEFTLAWCTQRGTFGLTTFRKMASHVRLDNEAMSRRFVKDVLTKYVEGKTLEAYPALLRQYDSIDALLDASKPSSPWS